jgi:hypothetical protein
MKSRNIPQEISDVQSSITAVKEQCLQTIALVLGLLYFELVAHQKNSHGGDRTSNEEAYCK